MPAPPPLPAEPRQPVGGRVAIRGARSAILGTLIAAIITPVTHSSFWANWVQSVSIAMCCWTFIDGGRLALAKWSHRNDPPDADPEDTDWPGWPLMFAAIAVGSWLGFTVGGAIATLILGHDLNGGWFRGDWRQTITLVLGSLVPGTVITYWYYSRETIAAKEAAVQKAQRQAAENQLKLLESQLEPHMLFNTLANLRVLIGLDPLRAQAMLDQLIAFLRATLNASRVSQHPLRAEFARLEDYLALMRVRMGDRLQTRFDLPPELAETPVPPLLLQPLVENSIKHGLEPAVEGGRIEVSASRVGNQLELKVRDTGVGLSGTSAEGTRFGLSQVRERLDTLYGSAASFNLAPVADSPGGVLATIRLPLEASALSKP